MSYSVFIRSESDRIFAKRMLDVILRDCITPEGLSSYQTIEAEGNVIIEECEREKKGDVWWSYSRSEKKILFSESILSLLKYVSLCNKS